MRNLEKEAIKADPLTIFVMGARGDIPQWTLKLDRGSALYKAIYNGGFAVLDVENMERCYMVYLRTEEDAIKMFRMVGTFPRTFWYKHKILKALAQNKNVLPPPV
jgi:hypothetical protein